MRPDEESQGPVIRDRRRIDPDTGQVRDPGEPGPRRGPAQAGTQPKPGRHSVSRPGGMTAGPGAGSPDGGADDEADTAEGPASSAAAPGMAREAADASAAKLAERTADLQRLQAEYANYRKRGEGDRLAV